MFKKILLVLLSVLMLAGLVSCGPKTIDETDYTLTLPAGYYEDEEGCYYHMLEDRAVFVYVETRDALDADASFGLREYVELCFEGTESTGVSIDVKDGVATYECDDKAEDGSVLHTLAYVYLHDDSFWTLSCIGDADDFEDFRKDIQEIAGSFVLK